jgi:hypothetical protein
MFYVANISAILGEHARLRSELEGRMEPLRHTSVLQFGTYEIALHSGELRKAGVRIKVQQQPSSCWRYCWSAPAKLLQGKSCAAELWPYESFGDFDQARQRRRRKAAGALGDSADNPR